jgi:orotate phosphoribosyltransferase
MKPVTDPLDVRRYVGSPHADLSEQLSTKIANGRVLLEGHFELQSGRHSRFFLRFAGLGWNHAAVGELARDLVERSKFIPREERLTVVAPESAGLLLARGVADTLQAELVVTAVDDHRRPTSLVRHGRLAPGANVLIVTDVVTTGASLEPLLNIPKVSVVGLAAFAVLSTDPLRRLETVRGIRSQWLVNGTWSTYERTACPLCTDQVPLVPAGEFN